ncbi:DUF1203 domain-containing protein [Antarctobacter sp.]|uniref:DUF1203 domain-containing protein n=1 Tax=Antarctobacter sp. TaxID=1872577 RepID=UPI002B269720|nr:DUF1203 domain-containing protein [Antarctobacter sp.]
MTIARGLTKSEAFAYRGGAPDAYGNAPERLVSDGVGFPCRCCLRYVPAGQEVLLVAHRPFDALHPYAETGPIFLCAQECAPDDDALPEVLCKAPDYLLKGYDAAQRIVYGSGKVVPQGDLGGYAETLLAQKGIAFVDVRSARNNCWIARITTG